jgi:hypothetical protein
MFMVEQGTPLRDEIRQARPFRSPAVEAAGLGLPDRRQHPILNGVEAVSGSIGLARFKRLSELLEELRAGERPDHAS